MSSNKVNPFGYEYTIDGSQKNHQIFMVETEVDNLKTAQIIAANLPFGVANQNRVAASIYIPGAQFLSDFQGMFIQKIGTFTGKAYSDEFDCPSPDWQAKVFNAFSGLALEKNAKSETLPLYQASIENTITEDPSKPNHYKAQFTVTYLTGVVVNKNVVPSPLSVNPKVSYILYCELKAN